MSENENEIEKYLYLKSAIQRAEVKGFKVTIGAGEIRLSTKKKDVEFPFFSASDLHYYLNGFEDGKNPMTDKK